MLANQTHKLYHLKSSETKRHKIWNQLFCVTGKDKLQIPFQTHLQKSIFVLVGQGVGEKDEEDVTTALTIDVPKVQIHNDILITLNVSSFRSKEGLSVIIWRFSYNVPLFNTAFNRMLQII